MTSAARETIAVLQANGITRIFGNPGTTELALLDATVSAGMDFHLCLHEGAAIAMADGYGRATGTTGVVMVHTSVGAANTLTNLINLRSDSRPLLVIAGDKDDRLSGRGCFCEVPDLPGLLRQVSKEAWRVSSPEKLPELTLRALKVAQAPTPGPVFLAVPENYMAAELPPGCAGQHVRPADRLAMRAHPDELRPVLAGLASARRPLLIAGNEVGRGEAVSLLVELANRFCVPVVGEEVFTTSALNFPTDHPLYHGNFSPELDVVRNADLVVAIGARAFMEYAYPAEPYIKPGVRFMQIGADPAELGKIYHAEVAVLGDAASALGDLLVMASGDRLPTTGALLERAEHAKRRPQAQGQTRPQAIIDGARTVHPRQLLAALDSALPPDAIVVDESVLSKGLLQRHVALSGERRYFGTSGGGLGWGMPAAIGVQLALPARRVVAFLGDGGALFNIQSLWTAAHLRLPVVIVVVNNGGYMAVRRGLGEFDQEAVRSGRFPGAVIEQPEVDLCRVAEGFGVKGVTVREPGHLSQALHWALELGAPALVDVRVTPSAYY
jgi:benzoylformate decarboxylase